MQDLGGHIEDEGLCNKAELEATGEVETTVGQHDPIYVLRRSVAALWRMVGVCSKSQVSWSAITGE